MTLEDAARVQESVGVVLKAAGSMQKVLDAILTEGLELLDAQYGNLLLVEGKVLVIRATTTVSPIDEIGAQLPIDSSTYGVPVVRREACYYPDLEYIPSQYRKSCYDLTKGILVAQ